MRSCLEFSSKKSSMCGGELIFGLYLLDMVGHVHMILSRKAAGEKHSFSIVYNSEFSQLWRHPNIMMPAPLIITFNKRILGVGSKCMEIQYHWYHFLSNSLDQGPQT